MMHTFNFITKRLPYLQQDLPIIDGTQHIGERTIEIPIAKEYIAAHDTDERFLEIGAVTPYFRKALGGEPTWPVYDLYDSWGRCVRMDAEDLTYTDANVLSISTIEHMGMLEYGNTEEDKVKAAQVFQKITTQARSFLLSWPVGHNYHLDCLARVSGVPFIMYQQVDPNNRWRMIPESETAWNARYGFPYQFGNVVVFFFNAS